jgi:hypothetical protein
MRSSIGRIALVAVIGATFLQAGPAAAEERVCRGTIGARTLDNVRVPQGATCTLDGTYVKGTVKVGARATLRALDVRVIGNVQAEHARRVVVREGSRIGGDIQIVQGGSARIVNNRIGGDILFDDEAGYLLANRNVIGGNLQAFQNTGGVEIRRNRIDGNLQCKENRPAPVGGGNIVEGNKEDQCRRL